MLKGTLLRNYRSSTTGNMVFVYALSGPAEELEAYKQSQIDAIGSSREDDGEEFNGRFKGQPLLFSVNQAVSAVLQTCDVRLSTKTGRYNPTESLQTSNAKAAMADAYKAIVREQMGLIGAQRGPVTDDTNDDFSYADTKEGAKDVAKAKANLG